MNSEIYKIKINNYIFKIQKSVVYKYGTDNILYYYLKIGGPDTCIEYKFDKNKLNYVELQWLHTEGRKCSYGSLSQSPYSARNNVQAPDFWRNIDIKKDKTIFLFNLSIELLKLYTPIKLIEFLDNSYFNCKLPDNSNVKIFLSHYYFIFHNGRTWYDDKFGAYPLNKQQKNIYDSFPNNFNNPIYKPVYFDFLNEDLNQIFQPLWAKTTTWAEFIDIIRTIPNICQKSYLWYLKASNFIRNNKPLPELWLINVDNLKYNKKEFKYEKIINAGSKSNNKSFKKYIYDISICPDYPNISDGKKLKFIY